MFRYFEWGAQHLLQEWNKSKELMDPRTEGWFLMESPFIPIGISGLYLAIIFATVPTFPNVLYFHVDKIQLPVKTKGEEHAWTLGFLHCYNLFNVLMNLFIAAGLTWLIVRGKYSLACEGVRLNSSDPYEDLAPVFLYLFHISKIIELGDTAFIILRGKTRQLTFLHVYHHISILCATWAGARFVPGGTTAIIALINCWIHVIMYSYYKFKTSSLSNHKQHSLFKRLLTIVQILQFVTTIWICLLTLHWKCGYPPWVAISLILYMLTFLVLFGHFYISTYVNFQ